MASIFDLSVDDIIKGQNPWEEVDKVTLYVTEDNKIISEKFAMAPLGEGGAIKNEIVNKIMEQAKKNKKPDPQVINKSDQLVEIQYPNNKIKLAVYHGTAITTADELKANSGEDTVKKLVANIGKV